MKTNLIAAIILATFTVAQTLGQNQIWQWAKNATGNQNAYGRSTATDANGNVYVTGNFDSTNISFGGYLLTNNSLASDIYLIKYDANGNVLWAKSAGGSLDDIGFGIATDNNNNIYITGNFYSPTITFGSYTLTNTNVGYSDIFIAKYDDSGNVLWAKSAGGTNSEDANSIATDGSGNAYIAGTFRSSTLTFGSYTLNNTNNLYEVFMAKYDSLGNVVWAKCAGGSASDWGYGVATDGSGNVYFTGVFGSDSITFGSIILNNTSSIDGFVVKYDSLGNALWANCFGGRTELMPSPSIDPSGNVYIAGIFLDSSITIGSQTLNNTKYCSFDVFVTKYTSSGINIWAKSGGGIYNEWVYGIVADDKGGVYITGKFDSPTATFGGYTLTNAGGNDIFIVKYNAISGNELWAQRIGGGGGRYDIGYGTAIDGIGNIYFTGAFASDSITFGSYTLINNTDSGNYNMYIAKLGSFTGINEMISSLNISVYPNPASDIITINIAISATIEIFNMEGQIIKRLKVKDDKTDIDISDFASGVYIIRAQTDSGITTKKFIKK